MREFAIIFFLATSAILGVAPSFAWTSRATTTSSAIRRATRTTLPLSSLSSDQQPYHQDEENPTTLQQLSERDASSSSSRRAWFRQVLAQSTTAVGASLLTSRSAHAAASLKAISNRATCDSTVTVWQRGDRLVYLLGTAHISQVSAELAGDLVKSIHPNAVFVELDLKRVGGKAVANQVNQATNKRGNDAKTVDRVVLTLEPPLSSDGSAASTTTRIVIPNVADRQRALLQQGQGKAIDIASSSSTTLSLTTSETQASQILSSSPESTSRSLPQQQSTAMTKPKNGLSSMLMTASTNAVGNAIRGMYQNLDKAGFKPGDEFTMAMQQAQLIGADIVLGDQDVELTLSRLTQALARTDVSKLLQANSDIEENMKELLGGPPTLSNSAIPSTVVSDLTNFVERIKTRDTVRTLINSMRQIAPELIQVMLTERDAYMAAGIDSLTQETVLVAVMGIAHVDGVEDCLKRQGWKQVKLNCAKFKEWNVVRNGAG